MIRDQTLHLLLLCVKNESRKVWIAVDGPVVGSLAERDGVDFPIVGPSIVEWRISHSKQDQCRRGCSSGSSSETSHAHWGERGRHLAQEIIDKLASLPFSIHPAVRR